MEYTLKDKTILAIALIVSALGILSLLLMIFVMPQKFVMIDGLGEYNDQTVSLKGTASNISSSDSYTRFLLSQTCYVEVIAFENISIAETNVSVLGKVQQYEGRYSILAQKITW